MKKIILAALAFTIYINVSAQSEKFLAAMKKNIAQIDSAYTKPDLFTTLSNNFERVATAEKNQWLAYYYAAYCKINSGFMQKDMSNGDDFADAAEKLINKADSLMPNNSEISCAKSMIATLRMLVNPQQRYMKYGMTAEKEIQKAIQQDPKNPRPHLLKGQNLKNTPEAFGGGCATAKNHLQKAVDLFAGFKPASNIAPNWGKNNSEIMLGECKVK